MCSGYALKEGNWRANQILPDVPNSSIWKDFLAGFDDLVPMEIGLLKTRSNPREMEVFKELLKRYDLEDVSQLEQGVINDKRVIMAMIGFENLARWHLYP